MVFCTDATDWIVKMTYKSLHTLAHILLALYVANQNH